MESITWDKKLKKQLKGKVLEASVVVPPYVYGLGRLALTEKQTEKIHVAENNWARRTCRAKQDDRRMVEL